jgi:hypothetical protein
MQGISAKQERRRERESALQGKQCLVCKRWFSRPSRSPGLCQRCAEKAKASEPLGGPTGGGVRGVTSLDPYPTHREPVSKNFYKKWETTMRL